MTRHLISANMRLRVASQDEIKRVLRNQGSMTLSHGSLRLMGRQPLSIPASPSVREVINSERDSISHKELSLAIARSATEIRTARDVGKTVRSAANKTIEDGICRLEEIPINQIFSIVLHKKIGPSHKYNVLSSTACTT
jgi:hypothetical protein